jgi:hypothetical protein
MLDRQRRIDSWDFSASRMTVWACQSWFCRKRGPFWVGDRKEADLGARKHRELTFLGLWRHQAIVCPPRGLSFAEFLRSVRL